MPKADLTRARWDRRLLRGTLFPLAFQGTMSCLVMRWRFVEDLRGEIVAPGRRPFPGFPDFSKRGRGDGLGDGLLAAYVPARCNQDPGRRCRLGEGFPHPPSDFSLPFHRDRWRANPAQIPRPRSLAPGSRPDDRLDQESGGLTTSPRRRTRSPGVRFDVKLPPREEPDQIRLTPVNNGEMKRVVRVAAGAESEGAGFVLLHEAVSPGTRARSKWNVAVRRMPSYSYRKSPPAA